MNFASVESAPVPAQIETQVINGLRLPKIPGLPDASTPGVPFGKLVAPPAPGSLAAKADMAVVKGAQLLRTEEGDAWAVKMANEGVTTMWLDLARRHRAQTGRVQGWLDTALLASTLAANGTLSMVGKVKYDRDRPFVVDPTIKPPVHLPGSKSYPSGHASAAYAAARVIATLSPELAKEAYSLAAQVAISRVYAGVHYPTDVVAGALMGTAVAEAALRATRRGTSSMSTTVTA